MRTLIIVFIACVLLLSCNSEKKEFVKISEIPVYNRNEVIIKHFAYTLSYNEEREQANWVAYNLTKAELVKNVERKDHFRIDSAISTGSSNDLDFKSSGYDRGHLAPAADMLYDIMALDESFYYSNICPQTPGFNRGIWKKLEGKVRDWAAKYDTIWIVTGPVLKGNLSSIGENKVSVPEYFYKVLLVRIENGITGIGFILPNKKSNNTIFDFAVTIDSVENLVGIDFYGELPDEIENKMERELDIYKWMN